MVLYSSRISNRGILFLFFYCRPLVLTGQSTFLTFLTGQKERESTLNPRSKVQDAVMPLWDQEETSKGLNNDETTVSPSSKPRTNCYTYWDSSRSMSKLARSRVRVNLIKQLQQSCSIWMEILWIYFSAGCYYHHSIRITSIWTPARKRSKTSTHAMKKMHSSTWAVENLKVQLFTHFGSLEIKKD